jgi:VanZ family protein
MQARTGHHERLGGWGALAVYALAIVYASLNPFYGWRIPDAILLLSWPRYWSVFDIVLNVFAYAPFGALLATGKLATTAATARAARRHRVVVETTVVGMALSVAMELAQTMLPQRVSSPLDVVANGAGAWLGAMVVSSRWGRDGVAALLRWRNRWVLPSRTHTWGLMLLGAWFVAQMNPLVPLFESGQFVNPFVPLQDDADEPRHFLPYAGGVALNVAGFAWLLSLLFRPGARVVHGVIAVLVAGFLLKVAMAALLLRAPQFAEWLVPPAIAGVAVGLAAFFSLRHTSGRWRAFAAAIAIFAGGLFAKMTTEYGAFDATIQLLNWPHGHVATFAGLTRWLHEIWPLIACLYASWLFVRGRPIK